MNDQNIRLSSAKIFLKFLKFGSLAWGGPIAQIAMLRKELVEEEKWVSPERFNKALGVYQVLPGPEAHEMCVWFGMIAGGRLGGFLAGLGFMLPGFLLMMALTLFYVNFGIKNQLLQSVFFGFQAAVIALIFSAVHRLGKHTLHTKELLVIAGVSALASYAGVHFLIILLLTGLAYFFFQKSKKLLSLLLMLSLVAASLLIYLKPDKPELQQVKPDAVNIRVEKQSYTDVLITGLKGGLLTFGGAYTAIPFIQEDAVEHHQWMTNDQFLDGIALSGILPAPLIIFSVFVGYFGAGWIGMFLITLGIFLPAFAFTLAGHKLIDFIIDNKSIHYFLQGVTAGVIGLIAVTAIHLFVSTITGWLAVVIFGISLLILYRFPSKFTPVFVIIGSGILALIFNLIT